MKFIAASSSILLWALHTSSAAAIKTSLSQGGDDFNSGVYHGADIAEYIWDEMGGSCSNIWTYEDRVEGYLETHYPTDTGNWRTDAFNTGVEAGADQVVDKYEYACLEENPEECNDLGQVAAQQIAFNFCPFSAADATSAESEPNYKAQCKDVAESICKGAINGYVQGNGCDITTSQLVNLQDKCEDQIESMIGEDDDTYIPPIIEKCSDGYDCASCTSNSDCTWFADLGYCETMCGQLGCGATVCAAEITTCEECLGGSGTDASGQYSWSPYTNECVEDCMFAPADASCFKAKSSYDPSGYDPSICDEIKDMKATNAVLKKLAKKASN